MLIENSSKARPGKSSAQTALLSLVWAADNPRASLVFLWTHVLSCQPPAHVEPCCGRDVEFFPYRLSVPPLISPRTPNASPCCF